MKRIAITGSGDLGQQIAYYIKSDTQDSVVGFFDDFQQKGKTINNIKILGGKNDIVPLFQQNEFDEILIAVGYKHLAFKRDLFDFLDTKIPFYTFIHSSCTVDKSAKIGKGVVVYAGCIIDKEVKIEDNVLMNVGCSISHNTIIGAHSFLAPRVAIAGFVNIGKCNFLGINSTVIDNIYTADLTQIGGAGVVIKNIEQAGIYVGNPVKRIKK
jgi:sugar O-acyltransferase (sialic acid O-acetyltransferase NeuD family)